MSLPFAARSPSMLSTIFWLGSCCLSGCYYNEFSATPASAPVTVTATKTTPDAAESTSTTAATAAAAQQSTPTAVPALEVPSADAHNQLSPDEIEAGWIKLFDGHTLFGWQPNSEAKWTVANGEILIPDGPKGLLCTTTRFANYDLRCDVWIEAESNSGIFLRTVLNPKNPAVDCYELNICDNHPAGFTSGSLVARAKPTKTIATAGAWHTYEATVNGSSLTVKLDGELIASYTDDTPSPLKTGFIGLQQNGGPARFRSIYLKPLGLEPLWNGKDLTGWRVVPGSAGTFAVEGDYLHVEGGRGFLETEKTAGDFVFQFTARTLDKNLNGGIFFRAMEGTEKTPSHGYEYQIHNGIKNGDRNQPLDHGTGAIFRRVSARRVVANDNEWLTGTLIADGPHFSTWVNGIQMVDWTDDRAPNLNPREGQRLEPGHFSLQGHDPGTKFDYKSITLAPLP
ncbi:MAG: DUF1080 domain-containing protein [Planctomyces sp.]|nr:DUF1080 domain-containing protein [Planctomyces sp.]